MKQIEYHPFPPFIPDNAQVLIMGTFPPKAGRWAMDFYYPNRINDFWRIMGLIFYGDKNYLYDTHRRTFRLDLIKELLNDRGIALSDTAQAVRRLRDNASDKFLDIVEPVNLTRLMTQMPHCRALATTGEKAGHTLAQLTDSEAPAIGSVTTATLTDGRIVDIYRMPSTSRAYPLPLEQKALAYETMFRRIGILSSK